MIAKATPTLHDAKSSSFTSTIETIIHYNLLQEIETLIHHNLLHRNDTIQGIRIVKILTPTIHANHQQSLARSEHSLITIYCIETIQSKQQKINC